MSQSLGMRLLENGEGNGGKGSSGKGGQNGNGDSGRRLNTSCYNIYCMPTSGSDRSDPISGNDTPCTGGTKIEDHLAPVHPASLTTHSWTNTITNTMCTVTLSNIV